LEKGSVLPYSQIQIPVYLRLVMRVFVGLSGGVDSSVTAALLKAQGHQVTGVFMKNWTKNIGGVVCPWRQDMLDAKRVAVQLGIPFIVFDFQREYKQKVVDYMISDYKAGRTPNPDVMCNQEIKFKLFLDTARENGADKIATGHYARVSLEQSTTNSQQPKRERFVLKTGVDKNKDQSYFLYRMTEKALARTLLPIGELSKPKVREIAKKNQLITAQKPDSQGICFVGEVGIDDFIKEFVQVKPGRIIDVVTGKVIGQHGGAVLYTIGQRHGLNIGGGLPYYVTATDVRKNLVYATKQLDNEHLWQAQIQLSDTHWINEPPKAKAGYSCRVRYRSKLLSCQVRAIRSGRATVILNRAERAITPGQSVVIYDNDEVLGGGIIS